VVNINKGGNHNITFKLTFYKQPEYLVVCFVILIKD